MRVSYRVLQTRRRAGRGRDVAGDVVADDIGLAYVEGLLLGVDDLWPDTAVALRALAVVEFDARDDLLDVGQELARPDLGHVGDEVPEDDGSSTLSERMLA